MRGVLAIFRRETAAYFNTSLGAIILVYLLVSYGIFFFYIADVFASRVADLRVFFGAAPLLLAWIVPVVTMRLVSEERSSGTIELLVTLPLRAWQIVLGKYLAAVTIISLGTALTFTYPLTLSFFGDLDSGPLIGGYLGLLLLVGAYVAVGLVCSALSSSQVIAALSALVACMFLWVIDKWAALIPDELGALLRWSGFEHHFLWFSRGVIDSRDLLFYGSAILLGIALATHLLQRQQVAPGPSVASARNLLMNSRLRVGLLALGLLALNYLGAQSFFRADLSEDRQYSLSAAARTLVRSLDGPTQVELFVSSDLPRRYSQHPQLILDKLEEFQAEAILPFEIRQTDPGQDEAAIERAGRLGVTPREKSERSRDRVAAQRAWLGLSIHHLDGSEVLPFIEDPRSLEYEIAQALRRLQQGGAKKTIGFVTGHGEPDIAAAAAQERHPLQLLATVLSENYDLVAVDLSTATTVSEEVDVLVLQGPRSPLADSAWFAIDQHVARGGSLAVFPYAAIPNVQERSIAPAPVDTAPLLQAWGLTLGDQLVIQRSMQGMIRLPVTVRTPFGTAQSQQQVSSPLVPVLRDLDPEHAITRRLNTVVAPFTRAVQVGDLPPGVEVVPLVSTAPDATVGRAVQSLDPRSLEIPSSNEVAGSYPVLVAATGPFPSNWSGRSAPTAGAAPLVERAPEGPRVLLSGSFELGLANPGLLLAMVDWMAADEMLLGIRPRTTMPPLLNVPEASSLETLRLANVAGVPLLVALLAGLRLRRRSRGGRP
ncbi:MAG: Gldg family protein [Myxococcota bacterium]|nr:Gldg family protein [Myxococcota bacterium]